MAGSVFKPLQHGWIKRQRRIKQRSQQLVCPAFHRRRVKYPTSYQKVLTISWERQSHFISTKRTSKLSMMASLNMMKMVSWLNCERFQLKTNWKRQKFLERGTGKAWSEESHSLRNPVLGAQAPRKKKQDTRRQ
jgi:hypothetical protein